jgi:hypothetical protein
LRVESREIFVAKATACHLTDIRGFDDDIGARCEGLEL